MNVERTDARASVSDSASGSTGAMYEAFSSDYDRFVDWQGRLSAEMPFILEQLRQAGVRRVLDAACGTGMHAIALAEHGFDVVGSDASRGMVEQAKKNALEAEADVLFKVAEFGKLTTSLGIGARRDAFDAILCLGNSLPHILTQSELDDSLDDFANCLRPGGVVLIQNRNFDAVLAERDRWMPLQSHKESSSEWLFVRFYDFESSGLLTFNGITLQRQERSAWNEQITSTQLWPLTRRELSAALGTSGFVDLSLYGDMEGSPFDITESPNLVVVAKTSQ